MIYLITTFCNGGNLEDFVLAHENKGIGESKATYILR